MNRAKQNKIIRIDEKTIKVLFDTLYKPLCVYAGNYISSKEVVEEVVQETFIRLWENQQKIEIEISAKSYLYRAVHNACLNYAQNYKVIQKKKNIISLDEPNLQSEIFNFGLSENILDQLINDEFTTKINSLIEKLPEGCKNVFKLSRLEDLSNQEIATKLDISINTVKTHIFRALDYLRKSLF